MRGVFTALSLFSVTAAFGATNVLRGPYLNSGSPTGMVVRWRTDLACNSVVRYGTAIASLDRSTTNTTVTTEHEVAITRLQADTKFYYSIGSSATFLAGGTDHFFGTSPTNTRPVRVWAIGDFGTGGYYEGAVRDAYTGFANGAPTDIWLMLGDNAYGSGTDYEYQVGVFDMFPNQFRNMVVWPTIGNHDAGSLDPNTGQPPYLTIFTLPQNGEAGGVPSGNELYYSFDYANIHFICLDTQISDRSTTGPMVTWLRSDLEATLKDWVIVFFHHPPYSWGTHNSDYDGQLTEVRQNILPLLEDYGADLVMAGHSHVYERSFLLDRHYGHSWDFNATNVLDGSTGHPYAKPAGGLGMHQGTVYAVCGNSGQGGNGSFALHPAMATNDGWFGSLVLDFNGQRLDVKYLTDSGVVFDSFAIDKSTVNGVRPKMTLARSGTNAVITWPSNPYYTLEAAPQVPGTSWQPVGSVTPTNGRRSAVTLPASPTNRFFRLRAQ